MASGILITYSGYPYTPASFLPDNGLANLAGALIKSNHQVLIMDYNIVEIVNRLITQDNRSDLVKLLPLLKTSNNDYGLLNDLKEVTDRIEANREKELLKIYKEIEIQIVQRKVNFVGFKLWMGDGFTDSIKIAEYIKRDYPRIKLYAGGLQVQLFRETIYKITKVFDAIAYGEGEEIIDLLARHSVSEIDLEDIPNIMYLKGDKIVINPMKWIEELDNIAYPIYDPEIYPACGSNNKIKIFSLDATRGCSNNCAFCVHPSISGRKIKVKSVNRILDEIRYIKQRYNSRAFRFSGSYTPTNILIDLSKRLIEKKIDIIYTAFSTLKDMKKDYIPILKSSGLFGLYIGIESADERILKRDFEKRFNPERAKEIIKNLIDSDIFIIASFIYPAPSEDTESRNKTLNYILELFSNSNKTSVTVHFPGLMALGKWAENPDKYGFEVNDFEEYKIIGMKYNIKQYLPHYFWGSLPYSINGKSHREIVFESGKFMEEIERHGVLTMLLDETALMAHLSNENPREFRDKIKSYIFTGDVNRLKEIVNRINRNVI